MSAIQVCVVDVGVCSWARLAGLLAAHCQYLRPQQRADQLDEQGGQRRHGQRQCSGSGIGAGEALQGAANGVGCRCQAACVISPGLVHQLAVHRKHALRIGLFDAQGIERGCRLDVSDPPGAARVGATDAACARGG